VHGIDSDAATRLARRLADELRGDVAFHTKARALYSSDASNYRVPPLGVVLPRDVDDLIAAVAICAEFGVPITPRGGGTSVVGNAIGPGVVLDTSRYLNEILDIDPAARRAVVQPGVVLEDLQRAAARHGLRFGPDPSSKSRCTIGGMVGNNAAGARSVAWGTTADNTRTLDVLTVDGTRFTAGPIAEHAPPIGLAVALHELVHGNLAVLRTALPAWSRRNSGYALHHLLPEHDEHLARALVGTEGTCVTVLGATLDLVEAPPAVALAVLGFPDAPAAADATPALLEARPLAVEGLDEALLDALRARGREPAVELPEGAAWLYVEMAGADPTDAGNRARWLAADAGRPSLVVIDPVQQRALWRIREEGAGLATRTAEGVEAWPGWEDACVPPERLGGYLRDFAELQRKFGRRGTVYGHFGEGNIHVRLDFDLLSASGVVEYRRFIEAAAALVAEHGGSLSGEHGDGRARGELLGRIYPPAVLRLFERFKNVFDPRGLANPGIAVRPALLDADLRSGPTRDVSTFLGFPADNGDLSRAVRRCIGVGACRRTDGVGVMCPSYVVTRDEQHSTRGRARLFAEMLDGRLIRNGWHSTELRDALDLCLACKGCRSDCPVNVDMASYKAEFLYQHYRHRPRPRDHHALGRLPLLARIMPAAFGAAVLGSPRWSKLAARMAGISTSRPLPVPARESLRSWLSQRGRPLGEPPRGKVLLWTDTFTNAFDPHVGQAAVEVLESVGFQVEMPARPVCCGLTYLATGQLPAARRVLRRSLAVVREHLDAGVPIVGLEPSCTAALRSDALELLPDHPAARKLSGGVFTLAELLATRAPDWSPRGAGFGVGPRVVWQTHCHQHAILGTEADAALLARAGVEVVARPGGCCGLAGSFGYQRGHEELSVALAERALLPALREAGPDAVLLADGFSCRLQARQLARAQPKHLAELLAHLT
jgi:FAD/FMN-containing dehydrogenase/Fe-S oxidoreductase